MLKLKTEEIIKAGGVVSKKREKQTEEAFCKIYKTPDDVIKYYNNPNQCINCSKIIPANTLTDYTQLKSQIFCSKHCSKDFFNKAGQNKVEHYRRQAIYNFHLALADCINMDLVLLDYRIDDELKSYMLKYVNAIDDMEV